MIAAAALAAGLAAAPPRGRAYTAPRAAPRAYLAPDERAWTLRVLALIDTGLRLCLEARSPAALALAAPRAGGRADPAAPAGRGSFAAPVWLFGPRGEVQVEASAVRTGLRCTVSAVSGQAALIAAAVPARAAALGFVRTPSSPARWPGEGAWRGVRGEAAGAYLATAAPLVHGAPYGALMVVARPASR